MRVSSDAAGCGHGRVDQAVDKPAAGVNPSSGPTESGQAAGVAGSGCVVWTHLETQGIFEVSQRSR
jgi:hypothetical protein